MLKHAALWFGLVGALATASAVRAQNIEGSARLALELAPLSYESSTGVAPDVIDDGFDDRFEGTQTRTQFGLTPAMFGLNLGYAPSKLFVVGTRVHLGVSSDESENDAFDSTLSARVDTTTLQLLPYVELMFGSATSSTRGTVGITVGYRSSHVSTDDGSGAGARESSFGAGVFGGLLGARFFLTDTMSIDPSLLVAYQNGTSTISDGFDEDFDVDVDMSGTLVAVLVSFSMWPGAKPTSAADLESTPTRAGEGEVAPTMRRANPNANPNATRSASAPASTDPWALNTLIGLPGHQLTVFSNVDRWGSKVGFTFMKRSRDKDALVDCRTVKLIVGEQVRELPAQTREVMGEFRETELLVILPYHEVDALSKQSTFTFDLCGSQLVFGMHENAELASFVRRMYVRADRRGIDLGPPIEEPMALPEPPAAPATPVPPATEAGVEAGVEAGAEAPATPPP